MKKIILTLSLTFLAIGCENSQGFKDKAAVERQQKQYAASQAVPAFNWSLERHLVIQLYQARNKKVLTHSVWRSITGKIEGDCPSLGFSIPYDTSLTNPLKTAGSYKESSIIEQAEPNGLFSSKNTAATWVMCSSKAGMLDPIYVETKVTVYPYPVKVDYKKDRVIKAGKSNIQINSK